MPLNISTFPVAPFPTWERGRLARLLGLRVGGATPCGCPGGKGRHPSTGSGTTGIYPYVLCSAVKLEPDRSRTVHLLYTSEGLAYLRAIVGEILDGKRFARELRGSLKRRIAAARRRSGCDDWTPGLATILIGTDPASQAYVERKQRACREVGIAPFDHRLPADVATGEVAALIAALNARADVHGILLQLPVPAHLDADALIARIAPDKDVDGLHPLNQGRLLSGRPGLRPCTPLGVLHLIDRSGVDLVGKRAVVVGRSPLVGRPTALLLLERHATVTVCHSRTADLADHVARADVVVTATGRAGSIEGGWIKPGAVVIDVGISRAADGSPTGDVEFAAARDRAAAISPVPGGVGPLTIAMLLANTLQAAEAQADTPAG